MHDLRHFGNLLRGVNFVDVSQLTFQTALDMWDSGPA